MHTSQSLSFPCSVFLICLFIAACSSGSSSGGSSSSSTGIFLDSPVQGLSYESGDITGITNADGEFTYKSDEPIKFKIGDIMLGETIGKEVITPIDLAGGDGSAPKVHNIARFLQTLDNNANPDNGINITEAVRDLARGKTIDFSQSAQAFANDSNVNIVVSELTSATIMGARTLVSTSQASSHLNQSVWEFYAGNYTGTYSGDDSGSFNIDIEEDGEIVGSGVADSGVSFSVFGQLAPSGNLIFAEGGTSTGATYTGSVEPDGTISGTWEHGQLSGVFSGAPQDDGEADQKVANEGDVQEFNSLRIENTENVSDFSLGIEVCKLTLEVTNTSDKSVSGALNYRAFDSDGRHIANANVQVPSISPDAQNFQLEGTWLPLALTPITCSQIASYKLDKGASLLVGA